MNAAVEQIIEAVLYEGLVLYPYRPSSKKNQRERFTFGRVYPSVYSRAQDGAEPCLMQTECLVKSNSKSPKIQVTVGFLHPIVREIGAFDVPLRDLVSEPDPAFRFVPELRVEDRLFQRWHEAAERKIMLQAMELTKAIVETKVPFRFHAWHEREVIRDSENFAVGLVLRKQETVEGVVEIITHPLEAGVWKVTVRIVNETLIDEHEMANREAIASRTLASTHSVLHVQEGEFVSLMDPPEDFCDAAVKCRNIGAFPVLVGDESKNERKTMLSSPIILYDYPRIAPESAGTMFDGTEIDEILTLRILTMTDEEKREMRHVDEQARRLLERTENLSHDDLLNMHGTMRSKPATIDFDDFFGASTPLKGATVHGVYLQAGDRVRINPKVRADVIDMALKGQTAVIEAVEQDLEKRVHFAVVLENDPGRDLGLMRQPGHRFFYGADEIEPLNEEAAT